MVQRHTHRQVFFFLILCTHTHKNSKTKKYFCELSLILFTCNSFCALNTERNPLLQRQRQRDSQNSIPSSPDSDSCNCRQDRDGRHEKRSRELRSGLAPGQRPPEGSALVQHWRGSLRQTFQTGFAGLQPFPLLAKNCYMPKASPQGLLPYLATDLFLRLNIKVQ